jgi:hypothetical protein
MYIITSVSISFDIIPSNRLATTLHVTLDYFPLHPGDAAKSFHFFLFPLNFISKILTEAIYNISRKSLGN